MSLDQIEILKRALVREKAARKQAEKILESKSAELYTAKRQLESSYLELETLFNKTDSQLQGVFENIVDAYVIMDLNGFILNMNDAALNLLGFEKVEMGYNLMEMVDPQEQVHVLDSFKNLMKSGTLTDFQLIITTNKNERKQVHINSSVIYDKGKPIAAQGIIRDITEINRATELIESQRNELDAIVRNSIIGIMLTESGTIIRSNESIQQFLGYSEKELYKLTIEDISLEEDYVVFSNFINKMNAGEIDNFVCEKRCLKKNGSILWAKTNVSAVRDTDGRIKYQVVLVEDITVAKEQSSTIDLMNSVAKSILGKMDIYEIASEITKNIAINLKTKDCIIYVVDDNRQILEQIGAFGDKVDEYQQIRNKIEIPIGQGIVGSVAESGIPIIISDTSEDNRYIVDDKRRYSEITVPIINDGKVIGIIDSEYETKNYFTEKQLETLTNVANLISLQLKSAINLRERERVEYKNTLLLEQLEKSNEELQEYAHIVSHDLKSPLRSIDALISWIKEDSGGKLDEESLKNFGLIEMTIEKMEQLISDILTYSSIDAKNDEEEEIDLNIIIKDLTKILYLPDHFSLIVKNQLPTVWAERTKLYQLFQNLINNAIKFNDKEAGIIEIDVKDLDTHYQFSVTDNGIGIEKKYHENIFKIFQSLQRDKSSSGIGLSIVRKVVESYQGELWLESELNKGTTFHFTFKKQYGTA